MRLPATKERDIKMDWLTDLILIVFLDKDGGLHSQEEIIKQKKTYHDQAVSGCNI